MKQRVAVVAFSAPPFSAGGVATAHYNLFRALRGAGFDARLFTFGDPNLASTSLIIRNGSPVWFAKLVRRACKYTFWILSPGKTAYEVADILAAQWGASRMSKAIARFSPDAIILSDHGAPGLSLKPFNAKVILVSHHNPARFIANKEFSKERSTLDASAAVSLEQKVLRKIDAVVCPSNYMRSWFRKTYRFVGKVFVIPNLLDSATIDKVRAKSLKKKLKADKVIYMPSAGNPLKGGKYVGRIIEGLTAKSARVAFYIPGQITNELLALSKKFRNRAEIFLPGQVTYRKHVAYVKGSDFGISPSLMENYSMALLEAVYSGVPMIAFKTGGNAEIIKEAQTGHLVKMGDVRAIVRRARPWLKNREFKTVKKTAADFSRKKLSPRVPLVAYAQLIESL